MRKSAKALISVAIAITLVVCMAVSVYAASVSTTGSYWGFTADCSISQYSSSLSASMSVTPSSYEGSIPNCHIDLIYLTSPNDLHEESYAASGTTYASVYRTPSSMIVASQALYYIYGTRVAALYGT